MLSGQFAEIKTAAKIEGYRRDILMIMEAADNAPLWKTGIILKSQCEKALEMVEELEQRLERKLIVSIIGPCGAGKSTLLNALAGEDHLSDAGVRRPTTQHVTALCRNREDAGYLTGRQGLEDVEIVISPSAPLLDHVILIDTPDTDSTHREEHIPLINKIIGMSDVLLCVFDGENPKRMDHADFMAPYVRLFHGMSLVAVVNKCDRQSAEELTGVIMPEFSEFLSNAWATQIKNLFCISARSHLKKPHWDPGTEPRSQIDQFDALRDLLDNTFRSSGFSVRQREQNAKQIRDYIRSEVDEVSSKSKKQLVNTAGEIRKTESDAIKTAIAALKSDPASQVLGLNVQLYQKLAQRWVGPVGWLVAVWTRILIFGTGFTALFRFGNPLRQLRGLVSSLIHYKESSTAAASAMQGEQSVRALDQYRMAIMSNWPDIAENLIKEGFDTGVRDVDRIMSETDRISSEINSIWTEAMDTALDTAAGRLSGVFLQLVLNLPSVGMLGYVGWLTASNFLSGNILSSDFFLHALLTIAVIIFLCFFILQAIVRVAAGRDRIHRQVFEKLRNSMHGHQSITKSSLGLQIRQVISLLSGP